MSNTFTTDRTGRRRGGAILAGGLLLGSLLAGCGGSDSSSDDSAGSTTGEGTTALTVMRSAQGQFESTIIADREGFFTDAGLDLTIEAGSGDPTALVPLLLNDQAQFAMVDAATAIRTAAQGVPISLVAGIQSAAADVEPSDGLLVPPGSPITSIEDMAGKTIGVSAIGGLAYVVNNIALEQAGVDINSVNYVQLPLDTLNDAATSGQVDAVVQVATFYSSALQSGFTALNEGTNGTVPGAPQVVWAASNQFIAGNPDVVARFVDVVDKANAFANDNPDQVRAIDHELTKLPAAYIDSRTIAPMSAEIDTQALSELADAMVDQGLVDSAPEVGDMVWSDAPTA